MTIEINIQCLSQHKTIPAKKQLQGWLNTILHYEHCKNAEITVRIVNKKESASLNYAFRDKAGATNVLSFVYQNQPVWGDIVLCAPLIAVQARERHVSVTAHWAHLITHGCLHLLGYDHVRAKDAKQMENKEIQLMKYLGFANPYVST